MPQLISFDEYLTILDSSALIEDHNAFSDQPYICVDWRDGYEATHVRLPACPVIAVGSEEESQLSDLRVPHLDTLSSLTALDAQATTCSTLVQLLRHNAATSIQEGLLAESLAYSTLQQSRGFKDWLNKPRRAAKVDKDPLVRTNRDSNTLTITLNRPQAHNAYSAALKDALCGVLHSAGVDPALEKLVLNGNGPSFCAGGDLSEFGQVTDAGEAHLSRTTRSAGALLSGLNCETEVHVHGACIGAGIEIPAFADRIVATSDAFFQLPEISMGLVPGAGGTVSITKKIGRHKTAYLAISNQRASAKEALDWGLIEEITK